MLRSFICLAATLLALSACRGGPHVNAERGAGHEREAATPAAAHSPSSSRRSRDEGAVGARAEEIVEITPHETEGEEPPELDLAIRVKNAYGYPAECLGPDAIPEGISQFSIRLSVTMTGSGIVTRSSVSAPVTAEAQACLERRAAGLRVAGPIPDAPRTVSTSIDVQAVTRVAAAATAGAPEGPQEYELPAGAHEPGTVLPAVVGDGPAPGYRPAARTLPAVAGEGPAEGSRPAGRTLPARGSSQMSWRWISGSAEAHGDVADNLDED